MVDDKVKLAAKLHCWQCAASIDDAPLPMSRHACCSQCGYELHCCRQCSHYRSDTTDRCLEDRAEVPNNKEVANFCDYYTPKDISAASEQPDKAAAAQAKLDALFGND